MVIFGLDSPESACSNAVQCALSMFTNLGNLQASLQSKGLPVIKDIGIGINFGKVIVGGIGSEIRRNFTVIDDTVNIASRLGTLTKQLKAPLVVSAPVQNQLNTAVGNWFIPRGNYSSIRQKKLSDGRSV